MSKDVNKFMATGRLGAEPEMRYLPTGSAICTFRVASGRSWKTGDGVQHEETEWIQCVAFEKLAEICNLYLTKGMRIHIEGRMQTRSWEDKTSGEKKFRTEIILSDMTMLSGGAPAEQHDDRTDEDAEPPRPGAARPAAPATPVQAMRPATPATRPAAPAARPAARNVPQAIEGDEDLPF